jgi:hypothetical protein
MEFAWPENQLPTLPPKNKGTLSEKNPPSNILRLSKEKLQK